MIRQFLGDRRGNYMLITAITMLPLMGAVAIGVDYTEMNRQLQYTQNALDAAAVATAHHYVEGASEADLVEYAHDFFEANLGAVDPADTTLTVDLPTTDTGGGTLGMTADLRFHPYFYPAFALLLGKKAEEFGANIKFSAHTTVRLKDTLEVALVLDNSGSMEDIGHGSGEEKIDLLKEASKQLITTLVTSAAQVQQVDKPVQFGIVPFAGAVNVGPEYADAAWMDTDGISPIHHENFDWTTFTGDNKKVEKIGGIYYKKGTDWGAQDGQKVTRFTLFNDLQRITGTQQVQTGTHIEQDCHWQNRQRVCTDVVVPDYEDVPVYGSYASWGGCVEQRPSPYDVNDTPPSTTTPATLFVPMFAPDETDKRDSRDRRAIANWWNDGTSSTDSMKRQSYMPKYYTAAPDGTRAATGDGGPNASCTTSPITPLTDVTNDEGMDAIDDAIDDMEPLGATSVPDGLAWGWRVVSSGPPFTEGRPESERGNDKVIIVLTDGANTYYTPESLGYNDLAGNKSTYSDYGYLKPRNNAYSTGRLFQDTTVSKSDYSNDNYSDAMNQKLATLCTNAKAANIIIMTVSLDLDENDDAEKAQIDGLKACASDSRFRKDPDTGQPAKLYWNATGADLSDAFREIADELSNLRIVS